MARLYTNENFPLPVVEALRSLGHDVLTSQEAGQADQAMPDHDVLTYARTTGRILLTLNRRHFIHLHQDIPKHSGIIVCTFDPDFAGHARRIHKSLVTEDALAGRLIRVNRPG